MYPHAVQRTQHGWVVSHNEDPSWKAVATNRLGREVVARG